MKRDGIPCVLCLAKCVQDAGSDVGHGVSDGVCVHTAGRHSISSECRG